MKRQKICEQCSKPLNRGSRFCSRDCKAESQKKRIELTCHGCSKKFLIHPYLKRQTNYCSRQCYRDSTKEGEHRVCLQCGKEFYAKGFLVKRGFGFFCGRACQFKAYPSKIEKHCLQCKKIIRIWPSKKNLVKFCSKECKDDFERDYVEKICRNCKKRFELPRSDLDRGRGTFCSRNCFIKYNGESSIEKKMRVVLENAGIDFKQEVKIGSYRADFLLTKSNVVLECDGEYWHSRPWSEERDKRKDSHLRGKGYEVIRVSEKTIRNLPEKELLNNIFKEL